MAKRSYDGNLGFKIPEVKFLLVSSAAGKQFAFLSSIIMRLNVSLENNNVSTLCRGGGTRSPPPRTRGGLASTPEEPETCQETEHTLMYV